jgi:hypothetical protein
MLLVIQTGSLKPLAFCALLAVLALLLGTALL